MAQKINCYCCWQQNTRLHIKVIQQCFDNKCSNGILCAYIFLQFDNLDKYAPTLFNSILDDVHCVIVR